MAFALTFVSACEFGPSNNGNEGVGSNSPGKAGGPCRADGTCDPGLECNANIDGERRCIGISDPDGNQGGGGNCGDALPLSWSGSLITHDGDHNLTFTTQNSSMAHAPAESCIASFKALFSTENGCALEVEAQSVVNNEQSARERMLVTRIALDAQTGCSQFPQADWGHYVGSDQNIQGSWIEMNSTVVPPSQTGQSCLRGAELTLTLQGRLSHVSSGKSIEVEPSRFEITGDILSIGSAPQCPGECVTNSHCREQRFCNAERLCEGCESCDSGEVCVEDLCVPQICEADKFRCEGRKLYRCDADGATEALVDTCESAKFCDADEEHCGVCEAGEFECDGQALNRCAQDGLSWQTTELCRDDEVCDEQNGRCEQFDCREGESFCRENDLWSCDDNGKAVLEERCDRDEVCDEREEECVDGERCEDDERFCKGDDIYECDEDDNDHEFVEDCSRNSGEADECHNGYCVPPLDDDDIIGDRDRDESNYQWVVGNIFVAEDFADRLYGFDAYLDIDDEDEELEWSVYEQRRSQGSRTYNRIALERGRARTTGSGWYASPELDIKINRGDYYLIAVGGRHGTQNDSDTHTRVFFGDRNSSGDGDPSFGTFLTSVRSRSSDDLGSSLTENQIQNMDDQNRAYHQRLYIER